MLRTAEGSVLATSPCRRHCSACEGLDHHWLSDTDDEDGEPIMVCKHCDAWRDMNADD